MFKNTKMLIGITTTAIATAVGVGAYLYVNQPETLQQLASKAGVESNILDNKVNSGQDNSLPVDTVAEADGTNSAVETGEEVLAEDAVRSSNLDLDMSQLTDDQMARIANGTLSLDGLRAELESVVEEQEPINRSSLGDLAGVSGVIGGLFEGESLDNSPNDSPSNLVGQLDIDFGTPDAELGSNLNSQSNNASTDLNSLDRIMSGQTSTGISAPGSPTGESNMERLFGNGEISNLPTADGGDNGNSDGLDDSNNGNEDNGPVPGIDINSNDLNSGDLVMNLSSSDSTSDKDVGKVTSSVEPPSTGDWMNSAFLVPFLLITLAISFKFYGRVKSR